LVEKHSTVQPEATTTETSGKASAETAKAAAETQETAATDAEEPATPTPKKPTSVSSGTVQAQGEVREAVTSTEKAEATKVSTDDNSDTVDKGDKPGTVKRATASAASSTPKDHDTGKKDGTGKKE
jgi:hypothetical protein